MRRASGVASVLLVVAGLVLLTVAYLAPSTPAHHRHVPLRAEQQRVQAAAPVVRGKALSVAPARQGEPLAVLRVPRFGADWRWVAHEGIATSVIDRGPGHYPGTALPGERGNAAFAAHRAGHGDPFIDFDRLRVGDRVIFESGGHRWAYAITKRPVIISPSDVWVIDRFAPGRTLTLTTCWPKYGSSHRMYVRARLIERTTR